MYKYL